MKEIKFRAFVRNSYMVDVVSIDFVNKFITWDDNQYDRCDPPNRCFETESFDEIKLMQFTGLLDKNNKEIYEGDIVQRGYIIKNVEHTTGKSYCGYNIGEGYNYRGNKTIEIIGHIYEKT